jgi:ornithine cyclodeaminase/alanine dehydrogenase-like protein (mu-crystallin family)
MTTDMIPYLDGAAVAEATPFPALIAALRAAFAVRSYHAPERLNTDMNGATLLLMPAWRGDGAGGVKIVSVDPRQRPSIRSTYVLADKMGGPPVAILDGTMLTRRRTAAASALAASFLARPGSRTLLLIGTGALIQPLVEAYGCSFALDRILIWGRDPDKVAAAVEANRPSGYPVEACADLDAAIAIADIVSTATLATSPLIRGAALRPGMHVDLIGAFRPDMCEADGACFTRARTFVDTMDGALSEAGDLIQAIAAGDISVDAVEGDLAALCNGSHRGRDGDEEAITLFKSVGTGIEDLAAARLALGLDA